MITTGVTGGTWRASITPWGAIEVWGARHEMATLDWFVAADDRWHVPSEEATVRQRRVDGTPVVETRLRVPRGDVVQQVYSCADSGGVTVIEVTNESTLPVAIAFSHRRVMTERPIVDVPIEGIELSPMAFVMPLGHRATVRIGVPHDGACERPLPTGLPSAIQVVRGWSTLTDRASRVLLPEGDVGAALAERIVAERCELALGAVPSAADQPESFALALHELVRIGERADPWLPQLVVAVEAIGRRHAGWAGDVALDAAGRTLALSGEQRAARDLERIVARREAGRARPRPPVLPPDGPMVIAWLESRLLRGGQLFAHGMPSEWFGQPIEARGLPAGRTPTTVAFAVRWHGERPAVLWEQTGDPVTLTAPACAPGWSVATTSGEALWPAPAGASAACPP
jgi:hypothetical protein